MTSFSSRSIPANLTRNGFEKFSLENIPVPSDGNCFFHAIFQAFYKPYRTGYLKGKPLNKSHFVKSFRVELADRLDKPVDPNDAKSPILYDTLSEGQLKEFAKVVSDFSLENMKKLLRGSYSLGQEILELISIFLDKDIFIVNASTSDIYIANIEHLAIKGRNSIVLHYHPSDISDELGHYSLLGIRSPSGELNTYFVPDHSFVQHLKTRLRDQTGVITTNTALPADVLGGFGDLAITGEN